MCDVNLIDLCLEDKSTNNDAEKSKSNSGLLEEISPTWRRRESLENNPFDRVQNMADRLNDPFDIVEREAALNAQQSVNSSTKVKLGKLLSLSDDNLLNKIPESPCCVTEERINVNELDLESPPVTLYEKQPADSVSGPDSDSNPNSAETSLKSKKHLEYRKRLLKLSISNASLGSPLSGKQSLEFKNISGTPVSSMLNKAAQFGEYSIEAESPLKLVEDEDLMSEEPPNFTDSEKNFEADLEMLKIPILSELNSGVEQFSIKSTEASIEVQTKSSVNIENDLLGLNTIKAKLQAKKEEINNNLSYKILPLTIRKL